jgi:hypothetical protein
MKNIILQIVGLVCIATAAQVHGDDAVVNTPVILSSLEGDWELQQEAKDGFTPRLHFDGSSGGRWFRSQETLPVSITFYVEGGGTPYPALLRAPRRVQLSPQTAAIQLQARQDHADTYQGRQDGNLETQGELKYFQIMNRWVRLTMCCSELLRGAEVTHREPIVSALLTQPGDCGGLRTVQRMIRGDPSRAVHVTLLFAQTTSRVRRRRIARRIDAIDLDHFFRLLPHRR